MKTFHFLLQLHSPLMQKNTAKPPGYTESKPKSNEGKPPGSQKGTHLSLREVRNSITNLSGLQ